MHPRAVPHERGEVLHVGREEGRRGARPARVERRGAARHEAGGCAYARGERRDEARGGVVCDGAHRLLFFASRRFVS